jgi:gliding motility-associated-like protein
LYTVSGDTTRLRDERVICDSFYRYRVKAVMQDTAITAFSNIDSASADDTKAPDPVYLQRASVEQFNDVVELKWEEAKGYDAAGYRIYRNNVNQGRITPIAKIKDPQQTTYYDSLNVTNREVCYEVRVLDNCGNASEISNKGCLIHPEGEALDLKNKLTWPDYKVWRAGANAYTIFKQVDSNRYREIGQTDSSQQVFIDDDLADSADQFCYYIRAEGFNKGEFSRSTKICLKQQPQVYIPNSFSPGSTKGLNDQFGPEGLYIKDYRMKIFNRWGQEIFSTSEGKKWDGTFEGEIVPQGVYTYTIVLTGEDGSTEAFSGTVTVIR